MVNTKQIEKKIKEARGFKPEISKIMFTLKRIKLNKPEKYGAVQRVLINQDILKPKKKFKFTKNPLQFTKKGFIFYEESKRQKELIKEILK